MFSIKIINRIKKRPCPTLGMAFDAWKLNTSGQLLTDGDKAG